MSKPLHFGTDLEFDNGLLTGFLEDGTPIAHEFQIAGSAQVNLINIPEPASITLMFLAVSICVLLKRRPWTGRRRSSLAHFEVAHFLVPEGRQRIAWGASLVLTPVLL